MNIKIFISRYKSLLESFFSLSILNALNVLLPLITIPYIIRIVGLSGYGTYSYVYVLIQYLSLFTQFGFRFSATKQIAQNRNNQERINTIFSSVLIFRIILLFIGIIFFLLISNLILNTREMKLMFIYGIGIVIGDILNPIWLFQGMEKMRYITLSNLFSKILFTSLIFILIKAPSDYTKIILYNSLGFILSGIISSYFAIKFFKIKFSKITWLDLKKQYKEGISLFGSTIGITLYTNINIFILKFFVSTEALGIYASAEKIIKGFQSLSNPISQALFPHLGFNFKKQTTKHNIDQLKKISYRLSILLSFISVLIFIFATFLIKIVTGSAPHDGIIILKLMSIIITIGGLNYLLGIVGLVNLNKQKNFFFLVLLSGISSVLFVLSTAPFLGLISGALGMIIAEIILFCGCIYTIQKMVIKLNNKSLN